MKMIHGEARDGRRTPEYETWLGIRRRCSNPNNKDWPQYGGAGVTVSPEWDDYEAFLRDMGRKPSPLHSIERIDGAKGYQAGNCRWATAAEQALNRRSTKLTHAIAAEIRARRASGDSKRALAAEFGVSLARVTDLFRSGARRAWPEVSARAL
jgi:hypothetical protein